MDNLDEESQQPQQPQPPPSDPAPPPPPQSPGPAAFNSVGRGIGVKLALIAFIFGALQVPLLMIDGVIEERQKFNVDYPKEFKGPGAGAQKIVGPVLTVPYRYQTRETKQVADTAPEKDKSASDKEKPATLTKSVTVTKDEIGYLHFFPESLSVKGKVDPEVRDEGKFKSILYAASLDFKGTFDLGGFASKKIEPSDLHWQDAFISLGISDLRGISKETSMRWGGQEYKFVPGTNGLKLFDSGQNVQLRGLQHAGKYPFEFTLHLNGSRDLQIFPAGKENKFALASTWPDPTFSGGFLPTKKTVTDEGFDALWEVSYFTRNLPQIWTDGDRDMKNSLDQYMVGLSLATPVDFYRTAIRAVKYGSLFIIMTFLTFFVFEMATRIRIHEVQYLLVGLALTLFFLMLIAISEWVPFVLAYILASVPTIAQIAWYTKAFSKGVTNSLWKVMALTLTLLYIYLYILLQLEDLSLLVGAIGLFIALTIVLYATRKVDWYGAEQITS